MVHINEAINEAAKKTVKIKNIGGNPQRRPKMPAEYVETCRLLGIR